MSYVSPGLKEKFETLPVDVKDEILSRGVRLENLNDLIQVLEQMVTQE